MLAPDTVFQSSGLQVLPEVMRKDKLGHLAGGNLVWVQSELALCQHAAIGMQEYPEPGAAAFRDRDHHPPRPVITTRHGTKVASSNLQSPRSNLIFLINASFEGTHSPLRM